MHEKIADEGKHYYFLLECCVFPKIKKKTFKILLKRQNMNHSTYHTLLQVNLGVIYTCVI